MNNRHLIVNAFLGVPCPLMNGEEDTGCHKMIIGKKVGGLSVLFGFV